MGDRPFGYEWGVRGLRLQLPSPVGLWRGKLYLTNKSPWRWEAYFGACPGLSWDAYPALLKTVERTGMRLLSYTFCGLRRYSTVLGRRCTYTTGYCHGLKLSIPLSQIVGGDTKGSGEYSRTSEARLPGKEPKPPPQP